MVTLIIIIIIIMIWLFVSLYIVHLLIWKCRHKLKIHAQETIVHVSTTPIVNIPVYNNITVGNDTYVVGSVIGYAGYGGDGSIFTKFTITSIDDNYVHFIFPTEHPYDDFELSRGAFLHGFQTGQLYHVDDIKPQKKITSHSFV